MLELFTYRNCTITIQCARMDFDCGPSLFKAAATVKTAEQQPLALLVGRFDESRSRACAAILTKAKREIECLERDNCLQRMTGSGGRLRSQFRHLRLVPLPPKTVS